MSMQDVLDSFWDNRLHDQKEQNFEFLIGKRIPLYCARTPDGEATIIGVRKYDGCFSNLFDCVVTLQYFKLHGGMGTLEMSYNSKDYSEN